MVALPAAFDPTTVPEDETPPQADIISLSPFRIACDEFIAAGYAVLPIWPGEKKPGKFDGDDWRDLSNWPDFERTQREKPSVLQHWKGFPQAGIGIILGTVIGDHQVIALDFDTDDADELDALQSAIPLSPMKKRGARGFTAFYRAGMVVQTKSFKKLDGGTKRTVLEFLTGNATKQTVMPPSIHPTAGRYEWYAGGRLVPAHELPILEDHDLEKLEDTLANLGCAASVERARPVAANDDREHGGSGTDYFRHINETALANLDAWVGALNLPKLRRRANGSWAAVADWRPSSTGRSMAERKANLSFHPHGIRDMGTSQGYTACDVVMRAMSYSSEEAFGWLANKLGLKEEDSVFKLTLPAHRIVETAEDGTSFDAETGEVLPGPAASSMRTGEPEGANDNAPATRQDREFPDRLTRVPGLLGDIIEYFVDTAECPNRALAFSAATVVLGTAIGRRDATPTKSGTHLYVTCLTETGMGKDHIQTAGDLLLQIAAGDPNTKLVGGGDFMSRSAFLRELKHPLHANFIDEFGSFLKEVNSKYAASFKAEIKAVLLGVWGRSFKTYRTPTWANEDSKRIEAPAVSILGCSTPQTFWEAVIGADRENGFLNRLLLVPAYTPGELREPLYDFREPPQALIVALQDAYRESRQSTPSDVQPAWRLVPWECPEAEALYKAFKKHCRESSNINFFVRSAEMAGRLATIRAVGRNIRAPEVSVADIAWGIEVAKWSATRMCEEAGMLIGDSPIAQARSRIMARVNAAKGRRINRTELLKNLPFSSKQLTEHLNDMVEMEWVRVFYEPPPKGGPSKAIVAAL